MSRVYAATSDLHNAARSGDEQAVSAILATSHKDRDKVLEGLDDEGTHLANSQT